MTILTNWDFNDPKINDKNEQQKNRQKSALNQKIISSDVGEQIAVFDDAKNGEVIATLESCTCSDFTRRVKNPSPCKHIYCLCFELGIMEPKFFDSALRKTMLSPEERRQKRLEEQRKSEGKLRSYERDSSQWGKWDARIHKHQAQITRQFRGHEILDLYPEQVKHVSDGLVHDYKTSLDICSCPDFFERCLPCKHVYCLAIKHNIILPLARNDYLKQKTEGWPFWSGFVRSL